MSLLLLPDSFFRIRVSEWIQLPTIQFDWRENQSGIHERCFIENPLKRLPYFIRTRAAVAFSIHAELASTTPQIFAREKPFTSLCGGF